MNHDHAGGLKTRDFSFNIKAVEQDGFFSGYGSVFNLKDSYGEVVVPGAFSASLRARAESGRKLPVLWQHRSAEPLGVYEVVREDATGLYLEGRLLVQEIVRAQEVRALMKAGAVTGLSIGYYVTDDSFNEKDRVRTLKALDLQETSIVTFPANDAARVEVVKAMDHIVRMDHILKAGRVPSLSEFESFLCEAGFSKTQARAIAGQGLRKLLDRCEADGSETPDRCEADGKTSELLQVLNSFGQQ